MLADPSVLPDFARAESAVSGAQEHAEWNLAEQASPGQQVQQGRGQPEKRE